MALTSENYNDWKFGNTFIQTPEKLTFYPKDYINEIISKEGKSVLFKQYKNQKIDVPYLTKNKISLIAEDIYNRYKSETGKLNILKVLQDFNINLDVTERIIDINTLAEINFNQRKITLFGKNHFNETQLNFAVAHEIGHFLLGHDQYLKFECQTTKTSANIEFQNALPINLDRIEYQANYFAACLLLPQAQLTTIFIELIKRYSIKYRGFSLLYVDEQPCNLDNYNKICIPIANFFMVSQEALKIRLTELGLAKFEIIKKTKPVKNTSRSFLN